MAPETDVGPSVMKPAVRSVESQFLVEVQEYRGLRSAIERLFQGLLPQDTCDSWQSQPVPLLARHGPYLTARYPLCRGADVLEGLRVLAGVNYPERAEERARPGTVESPGPPGSPPVERADREEPREPAVQPGLATVTGAAEPVQVLQRERSSERLRSHRPGDVDRKPVVELRGRTAASLAHRYLDADGFLS